MILMAGSLAGLLLPVACAPADGSFEDAITPTVQLPDETATPVAPASETTPPPAGLEHTLEPGEVPSELFDAVLTDLLDRTGASIGDVVVVKSEEVIWNDGSLGCPQPDMMYTQALVDGYQVVFEVNGASFDYHLSAQGNFVLCGSVLPPMMPAGTPTQ